MNVQVLLSLLFVTLVLVMMETSHTVSCWRGDNQSKPNSENSQLLAFNACGQFLRQLVTFLMRSVLRLPAWRKI